MKSKMCNSDDSPLTRDVKAIVAEILGIDSDGIDINAHIFYDLGASSIQYFSILTRLSEKFSITNYEKTDKISCQ